MKYELSKHAADMLKERNIKEAWLTQTLNEPDWKIELNDNTTHYFKSIPESKNRFLRVIINKIAVPSKVVTVFFDRNARSPK